MFYKIFRLWGDHGQACLEAAHICLINATGLGTEILKSLVLPGIGAFTIVDGKKITNEDIGAKYEKDIYIYNVHLNSFFFNLFIVSICLAFF